MLVFLGSKLIDLHSTYLYNVKNLFHSVYDDPKRKNNVKSEDFKAVVKVKLCSLARKLTHEPLFSNRFYVEDIHIYNICQKQPFLTFSQVKLVTLR